MENQKQYENTASAAPHDTFILYSTDVPLANHTFYFEGEAQQAAELVARSCKGARISIARIIASVIEPLTPLDWTDGRPAGNGLDRGGLQNLAGGREVSSIGSSPMTPTQAQNQKRY